MEVNRTKNQVTLSVPKCGTEGRYYMAIKWETIPVAALYPLLYFTLGIDNLECTNVR